MATNVQILDWQPSTPTDYAQPVLVEDATAGLSGCQTPDGRGVLVWPNGGSARFAILDSPRDFLITDIVEAGDIGTIVTGDVRTTSCYTIDGEVYATVVTWDNTFTTTKFYQVDNPSLSTYTWSAVGTIQADNTPGSWFGPTTWPAGVPTRLDSGRWVFGQMGWEIGFPPDSPASGAFAIVHYTDTPPAGPWTRVVYDGFYQFGFPRLDWASPQIGIDPLTGYLYWNAYSGVINTQRLYQSTNDGSSFTAFDATDGSLGAYSLQPVLNNGTSLYGFGPTGDYLVNDGGPTGVGAITDLNTDGGWSEIIPWPAPGMSTDLFTRKGLVLGGDLYLFALDQVAFSPGPAHCTDPTPPLHIPYKDYLAFLAAQYAEEDGFSPGSFSRAADQDFDNLKTIERWAARWMSENLAVGGANVACNLHIPYKDHLWTIGPLDKINPATLAVLRSTTADNYSTIERWAHRITNGECSCPGPERCFLHIPHKHFIDLLRLDSESRITRDSLLLAAQADFDNYKVIERWGTMYARGECH